MYTKLDSRRSLFQKLHALLVKSTLQRKRHRRVERKREKGSKSYVAGDHEFVNE